MADDRARATVRLSQESYDRLCAELSTFQTDTARFQFVVQFYLDYKQTGRVPREDNCTGDCEEGNAPTGVTDAQRSDGRVFSHRTGAYHHSLATPEGKQGNHQADHGVDSQ